MDLIGPREVLIAVGLLVLLAVILDGARRIKHHRYENLHMSSRKLQKSSKADAEEEDDLFNASQFPSGGGRVVGIRDEEDIQQVEENLRRALDNKPDFGFNQPRQEQFDLNDSPQPEETPEQRAALSKLETALALVDGWADDVTTLAAGDRLPAITQLREIYRRQRATNAPAQQLFKSLLGLEVSPKLTREASAFWQKVRESKDVAARDQIWSGILPSAEELLEAEKFLTSSEIPDDLSGLL